MSTSASKPLPTAKALPRAEAALRLVAVPVVDDEPLTGAPASTHDDTVAVAVADAPSQITKLSPPLVAEPAVEIDVRMNGAAQTSQWSVAAGLWLWRLRLAFGSSSISATAHGVAIIVLAVVTASSGGHKRPPPRRLEVSVQPPPPEQEILPKLLPQLKPQLADTVKSDAEESASGDGSAGSRGGRGGGSTGGFDLAGLSLGPPSSTSGGTGFGTDDAYGNHMLGEIGELAEPSATFFGIKAEGRKFCFVVDTSGSMAQNARFLRCRAELLRSLSALTYGQQYYVVFFNHTTFSMPERKLVDARPVQVKKTQEWCVNAVPAGGTEPWPGLQLAMRLEPDAIYLLTDGQFDAQVVDAVINSMSHKSKKTPIHTIAFESPEGAQLLETISRVTGGQHQFVP